METLDFNKPSLQETKEQLSKPISKLGSLAINSPAYERFSDQENERIVRGGIGE